MTILLDTHVLLWWLADNPALGNQARVRIAGEDVVLVSAVSIWEISIKRALGKLELPEELVDHLLNRERFTDLPLTSRHAWIAGQLPQHHRDPFDRGLIAQALVESVPLVTGDERIGPYTSEGLTVVGVE